MPRASRAFCWPRTASSRASPRRRTTTGTPTGTAAAWAGWVAWAAAWEEWAAWAGWISNQRTEIAHGKGQRPFGQERLGRLRPAPAAEKAGPDSPRGDRGREEAGHQAPRRQGTQRQGPDQGRRRCADERAA